MLHHTRFGESDRPAPIAPNLDNRLTANLPANYDRSAGFCGSAMPPKAESRVLSDSQKNHHEADDKYDE